MTSPTLLCILDGFGLNPKTEGNAVAQAKKPVIDALVRDCPHATLTTFGEQVGLPEGQMGNSEVGHLNIGAGRVVEQWLLRISRAFQGTFLQESAEYTTFMKATTSSKTIHVVGLYSTGGVHSHLEHMKLFLKRLVQDNKTAQIGLHLISDGRDVSPNAFKTDLADLQTFLKDYPQCEIASVCGRFFAMDRDKRWERTKLAYDVMVNGAGDQVTSATEAIQKAYAANITDEFITPAVVLKNGAPVATIQSNDAIIGFNFRADRMRQITRAFVTPDFAGFERTILSNLYYVCMTEYEKELPVTIAFANDDVENPLAKVISDAGLTQLHAAETEKYPHVTFYFNGGREIPFPGEERLMVASPKVATYDLQPEMSAAGIRDGILQAIADDKFDVIIVNFANPDMVGHTGVLSAVITAVETVDQCIGALVEAVVAKGGVALVTADHGNAEYMIDGDTGGPFTAHTINQVPVILVAPDGSPYQQVTLRTGGRLSDIAPTVLDLLTLDPAPQMTGTTLINH